MRRSAPILLALAAVGAFALAACDGSDDPSNAVGGDTGSEGDVESPGETEAGVGEFVSGTVTLTGAEESTYSIDDPAYTFFGAGGCSDTNFAISFNAREADTEYTALQLEAQIDADLNGGGTGTYDVEKMTLIAATGGDLAASRTYSGPGTMSITEHDTGGSSADLIARRMAFTLEGTLEADGLDGEGEVDVAADVLWVMGCP